MFRHNKSQKSCIDKQNLTEFKSFDELPSDEIVSKDINVHWTSLYAGENMMTVDHRFL